MPPSLSDDFVRTPIIFIGRVIATNTTQSNPFMGHADMTVEVEEAFKVSKKTNKILILNLTFYHSGYGGW